MFITICLIIPFANSGVMVIKIKQLPACWAVNFSLDEMGHKWAGGCNREYDGGERFTHELSCG